jgi:predicted nucleotidyltransferase
MAEDLFAGPQRFQAAYQCIEGLQQHERYLSAYIFGSFARRGDRKERPGCA